MTLAWAALLPHTDKLVLLALADNANDEGFCWPSVTTLSVKCGLEVRSVSRVMERLETSGHLTRKERPGRSNTYVVHPRLKVTPDLKSPLTDGQATPDPRSPPPPTHSQGTPDPRSPITIREPSSEPSVNLERGSRAARAPTAKRLPADFDLSETRKAIARAENTDPEREFAKFCDHWRAASGSNARKHDWDAAWRNWCRKAADFKPRNGAADSSPTLTWRPSADEDEANAPR